MDHRLECTLAIGLVEGRDKPKIVAGTDHQIAVQIAAQVRLGSRQRGNIGIHASLQGDPVVQINHTVRTTAHATGQIANRDLRP